MIDKDKSNNLKTRLKVLSLCGGIETGLLAMMQLGIPIAEYHTYEILPEAIAVSQKHFPWIVHHGNLFNADYEQFKGFDLVIGGMCCQSISRLRIEDKEVSNGLLGKSGIVYELEKAIRIIKPKWFFAENVIPHNPEDLKELNRIMGVDGVLINSALFSAQERERYYWTNIPIKELPQESNLVFRDIMQGDVDEKYFYKDKNFRILNEHKRVCGELLVNTTEMCKRIYNPDYKMATLTCISGGYQEKKVLVNGRPRKLTEIEYERLQGLPDGFCDVEVNNKRISYSKRCSLCGNAWNLPTVKHIFKGVIM